MAAKQRKTHYPYSGTCKINHLEENITAIDIELTEDETGYLDEILSAENAVVGAIYPVEFMKVYELKD